MSRNSKSLKVSQETDNSIFFFGEKDKKYGFCSNFYKCKFIDENNVNFTCSEQYFMYMKCLRYEPTNTILKELILETNNPRQIKLLGRKVKNFKIDDWSQVSYSIMLAGLKLKFKQNPDLASKLLETGSKNIYEASPYDKIWGIGLDPSKAFTLEKEGKFDTNNLNGMNLLGKALMEVRKEMERP